MRPTTRSRNSFDKKQNTENTSKISLCTSFIHIFKNSSKMFKALLFFLAGLGASGVPFLELLGAAVVSGRAVPRGGERPGSVPGALGGLG